MTPILLSRSAIDPLGGPGDSSFGESRLVIGKSVMDGESVLLVDLVGMGIVGLRPLGWCGDGALGGDRSVVLPQPLSVDQSCCPCLPPS